MRRVSLAFFLPPLTLGLAGIEPTIARITTYLPSGDMTGGYLANPLASSENGERGGHCFVDAPGDHFNGVLDTVQIGYRYPAAALRAGDSPNQAR
jgi:hypothetical protein